MKILKTLTLAVLLTALAGSAFSSFGADKDAKALRSQQFGFLLEEDKVVSKDKGKGKERGGRDKRDRHTRKRETDGREWESDEGVQARKRLKTDNPAHEEDEELEYQEDNDERREKERLQDLEERDAFAERVRQKDRDKTKKVVEDYSSK